MNGQRYAILFVIFSGAVIILSSPTTLIALGIFPCFLCFLFAQILVGFRNDNSGFTLPMKTRSENAPSSDQTTPVEGEKLVGFDLVNNEPVTLLSCGDSLGICICGSSVAKRESVIAALLANELLSYPGPFLLINWEMEDLKKEVLEWSGRSIEEYSENHDDGDEDEGCGLKIITKKSEERLQNVLDDILTRFKERPVVVIREYDAQRGVDINAFTKPGCFYVVSSSNLLSIEGFAGLKLGCSLDGDEFRPHNGPFTKVHALAMHDSTQS